MVGLPKLSCSEEGVGREVGALKALLDLIRRKGVTGASGVIAAAGPGREASPLQQFLKENCQG